MTRELLSMLLGAISGLLIAAALTFGSVLITSDSTAPPWTWSYVRLVSVALGVPIGAASAFIAYRFLLVRVPTDVLVRWLPWFICVAFVGALPALLGSVIAVFTAPLLLFAGAAWMRSRWERTERTLDQR